MAYNPLSPGLAREQEKSRKFSKNWKEYVGGGDLAYTRSDRGRESLLKIRSYNRRKIKRMTYDIWK
jgi:hypothetical protein